MKVLAHPTINSRDGLSDDEIISFIGAQILLKTHHCFVRTLIFYGVDMRNDYIFPAPDEHGTMTRELFHRKPAQTEITQQTFDTRIRFSQKKNDK
jgi:hypothetical protein